KAGPHVCVLPVLRADPKFTLRARAWVSRLSYDKAAKKVTGVVFTDTRTGEEYEQPAGLVVLSAYVFGNISLLLNSGIAEPYDPLTQKGAVGKNSCYQLSRLRARLSRRLQDPIGARRRTADQLPAGPARYPALGQRLEEGDRQVVSTRG